MTTQINQESEQKRLKDFEHLLGDWDKMPDRIKGRIEGISWTLQDMSEKKIRKRNSQIYGKEKRSAGTNHKRSSYSARHERTGC